MSRAGCFRIAVIVSVLALAWGAEARAQTPTPTPAPLKFFAVTPCRLVDTRNATGTNGGPSMSAGTTLATGGTRNFQVTSLCGVPLTAKAATLNVTVANPTSAGYFIVYPFGAARPVVSTLNWDAGEPALANGAIVPLGSDPSLQITVFLRLYTGGTANAIIDVTGYFQ
jgi:hypothetical protein